MNIAKTLRASLVCSFYALMFGVAGMLLFLCDEVIGWDIIPDWLDAYAVAIVLVLAIFTLAPVSFCLLGSATLGALAAAKRAGLDVTEPDSTPAEHRKIRRRRILVVATLLAVVLALAGLDGISRIRSRRQEAAWKAEREELRQLEREKHKRVYGHYRDDLFGAATNAAAHWTPALGILPAGGGATLLDTVNASPDAERALAGYLASLQDSLARRPEASLVVPGKAPYRYDVLSVRDVNGRRDADGRVVYLAHRPLIDLPAAWESEVLEGVLAGEKRALVHGRHGTVLNTDAPTAWIPLRDPAAPETVVGMLLLRAEIASSDLRLTPAERKAHKVLVW